MLIARQLQPERAQVGMTTVGRQVNYVQHSNLGDLEQAVCPNPPQHR